ncbi:MAG: hypothetical protein OXG15_08090 [Gammaproteobacteria bacterium]|nr:hypothetical protein [Gammaproteobacteria bacterium]
MELTTFVVLIVLISCSTGVITSYFKSKKRASQTLLKRIERIEKRISDDPLEERVQALEAILTDEKRRLDREIRSL